MNQARIESGSEHEDNVVAKCHHCKAPLESHKPSFEDSKGHLFCCPGCRAVYSLLVDKGLLYYYTLSQRLGGEISTPHSRGDGRLSAPLITNSSESSATVQLMGIHCASCVWLLERLPTITPGVLSARVSLANGEITVSWDPDVTEIGAIIATMESLGYRTAPKSSATPKFKSREDLVRLGVAGAAAMNIMVLAVSLYQGEFTGIEPEYAALFRWCSFSLATPAVFFSAIPIYSRALAAVRSGALHIDIPIALGILLSFALSAINTIRGVGEVYFDSVTTILFLLLASRIIHQKAFESSRRGFTSSWSLLPAMINRVSESGAIEELEIQALQPNMLLHVRPGERVPCDGLVESGESELDLSTITGEALPQLAKPGSAVLAGCLNIDSPLTVRAATKAGASQLDRILASVSAKTGTPANFVSSFDNLSAIFTAAAILLAVAAFLANLKISWDAATSAAIAMLTVTCPCAVALALPLLSIRALHTCSRNGILVATPRVFEELPKIKSFCFDKTGTLTKGRPEVIKVHRFTTRDITISEIRAVLIELTNVNRSHPISRAIADYAERLTDSNHLSLRVISSKRLPGRGISLNYAPMIADVAGSQSAALSSLSHFLSMGNPGTPLPALAADSSVVVLTIDQEIISIFELSDRPADDAKLVVSEIQTGGSVSILSGDRPEAVKAIAHELGIDSTCCHGGLKPEDKALIIRDKIGQPSLFVGDGANDAPALLEATVGIALHGGVQSLIECADACIVRGGIGQVVTLNMIAHRYRDRVRIIIFLGLTYNTLGICAAMFGLITPLIAALAMPLFSTILITIAYSAFSWSKRWI